MVAYIFVVMVHIEKPGFLAMDFVDLSSEAGIRIRKYG
jgi:hypothetical protein